MLDTLSGDLSEGERQRVMLSQAVVHEPDLVFIDEPLVNLDPLMQEEVKTHLQGYCAAGNTLFLSTHFMSVAEQLCTEVGIIADCELVAQQDPASSRRAVCWIPSPPKSRAAPERPKRRPG